MRTSQKKWTVFARPLMESVLKDHCKHPKVAQLLFFNGPRGVGKRTLMQRLIEEFKAAPDAVAHVDFRESDSLPPWSLLENPRDLRTLRLQLEGSLESLTRTGVDLGCIGGEQVYVTLKKWHGIDGALLHFINKRLGVSRIQNKKKKSSVRDQTLLLWRKALQLLSEMSGKRDGKLQGSFLPDKNWEDEYLKRLRVLAAWNDALKAGSGSKFRSILTDKMWDSKANEELKFFKETLLSLYLAKELLSIHEDWRANAVQHLKKTGKFSRMLAHTATNWPLLLVELLSSAVAKGFFQPKLIIRNIEVLRKASSDSSDYQMVNGAMYHDSLLLRLVALGLNEQFLPVVLLTSDSYYSFQINQDFGHPNIFIHREEFGWTAEEAKIHMVPDYYSEDEWQVIANVLGPNSRHLSEVYALKRSGSYSEILREGMGSGFEDVIDIYLGYLQVEVVNPAMEEAINILKAFATDAFYGRVQMDILRHGAPWRHPPDPSYERECHQWAKIQLLDYIQALINAEFGVNYLWDSSFEILDDPATQALLQVGLLHKQRQPQFIRPLSRGIERCLVRWLVQQKMQFSTVESIQFIWHRAIRGRSYRHLLEGKGI